MCRVKISLIICGLMLMSSGCMIINAQDDCRARGGTWSKFNAIGQEIWPGRCVGAMSPRAKASKFKAPKSKFIRKQDVAAFPKSENQPTKGERYLMNTVSPFLCEVVKYPRPEQRLKVMGSVKQRVKRKSSSKTYDYKTENFRGIMMDHYDSARKNVRSSYISLSIKNWPFTQDELTSWLLSRGFEVFLAEKNRLKGLAGYHNLTDGGFNDPSNYGIVFSGNYKDTATNLQIGISISWENYTNPSRLLCDD